MRLNAMLRLLNWIFVVISVCNVRGGRFRGGAMTWRPSIRYNNTFKEVLFTFRLSWTRDSYFCDDETIKTGILLGNPAQKWECQSGCQGPVGSTEILCTNFSRTLDFSTGTNHFAHVFRGDGPFAISSSSCCWGDGGSPNSRQWNLTTQVFLGTRNDTNASNFAPIVRSPLVVGLLLDTDDVIDLIVDDDDNDVIRCRLGNSSDGCGDACGLPRGFILDQEACRVLYRPAGRGTTGSFPIALLVEDVNRNGDPIRLGERTVGPGGAISSVPFQFSVVVINKTEDFCANIKPTLNLTRLHGDSNSLRPGKLIQIAISGNTCSGFERIESLQMSGGEGVSLSKVTRGGDGFFEAVLSWRPTRSQLGFHKVCVNATQRDGLVSENYCFNVTVLPELFNCKVMEGGELQTFDNHQFSFTSRCRLQLASTSRNTLNTSGKSVPSFNISILSNVIPEGEALGVERVFISFADIELELRRGGQLLFFGNPTWTPLRIGGVRIDTSGQEVVMTTETGMTLNYDGVSSVTLTLPQYYVGSVEGLCGNFNLDPNDDPLKIAGATFRSAGTARIQSRFYIDGPDCHEESAVAARDELPCGEGERSRNSAECELFVEEEGCFRNCFSTIDPGIFHRNCMTALCDAQTETRRQQLSAYASACHLENATVCNWRERLDAEVRCPLHSHYTPCGAITPPTCTNLTQEVGNPRRCAEGCECDRDYVLSGAKCIPRSWCGCFIRGSFRERGFIFRTDDCRHECTCIGLNETTCSLAPPCSSIERCRIQRNRFAGCVPMNENFNLATCKVIGDPHYQTFDGAVFDSMSTCAHILVKSKENSTAPPFTVVGINEAPPISNAVSFLKGVQVSVGGETSVNISLEQEKVLRVNGGLIRPGSNIRGVRIRMGAVFLVVSFDFGLVIRWDGVDRLRISALDSLRNQVGGLCGNFDGDPTNDYAGAGRGRKSTSVNRFVSSWLITGPDFNGDYFPEPPQNATEICLANGISGILLQSCVELFWTNRSRNSCNAAALSDGSSPCDTLSEELRNQYRRSCEILINPEGPFNQCHAYSNPFPIFTSCLFDLCAYNGNNTIRERIISSYAIDCAQHGVSNLTWRNETEAEILCGEGSEPSRCLHQCEATCADLDGEECREDPNIDEYCEEGCRCLEGFVRSLRGDVCVARSSCGCVINDVYQEKGFIFRRGGCSEVCVCRGEGVVECSTSTSCTMQQFCSVDEFGFEECAETNNEGATCSVAMGRDIRTFDGAIYNISALCSHVIARARNSENLLFSIVVTRTPADFQQSGASSSVVVIRYGGNSTLLLLPTKTVLLNGAETGPYADNEVEAVITDQSAFVVFSSGFVVQWDFRNSLNISASASLRHRLEGLCGNFDDVLQNDLLSSSGVTFTSVDDLLSSWKSDEPGVEGCPSPPISDPIPQTCDDREVWLRYRNDCFILIDSDGPLRRCQTAAESQLNFQSCVTSLCSAGNDVNEKNRVLTSYLNICLNDDHSEVPSSPPAPANIKEELSFQKHWTLSLKIFYYQINPEKSCDQNVSREEEKAKWREETLNRWTADLQRFVDSLRHNASTDNSQACSPKWTDWMDRDDPDGTGDDESLDLLQQDYPGKICRSPVAMEARLSDGRWATMSGNSVQMGPDVGLVCLNQDQRRPRQCEDFQVRFLCLE